MRRAALLVILLSLANTACVLVTEPGETLPPATLPVEMRGAAADWEQPNPFSIQGAVGSVVVRDRAMTGVCHRHENHGAYRDGAEIVFWMAHTGATGDICQSLGRMFGYEAVISGLQPGEHTVRVEYIGHVSSDGYPQRELRGQVTVR